jgi:synaptobrevin family protein YKT6
MVTDLEYPYRPAFSLLTKILDEHQPLLSQLPATNSAASAAANAFGGSNPSTAASGLPPAQKGKLEGTLAQYLTKYQDPKQADTIMKVQKELDETKIVLVSCVVDPTWDKADVSIAQDDRVGLGARREARQLGREI